MVPRKDVQYCPIYFPAAYFAFHPGACALPALAVWLVSDAAVGEDHSVRLYRDCGHHVSCWRLAACQKVGRFVYVFKSDFNYYQR